MRDKTDPEPVWRVYRGSLEAASVLFRRRYPAMVRYARTLTNDPTMADDLAPEAFESTLELVRSGAVPHTLGTYLTTAVRNGAVDEFRPSSPLSSLDVRPRGVRAARADATRTVASWASLSSHPRGRQEIRQARNLRESSADTHPLRNWHGARRFGGSAKATEPSESCGSRAEGTPSTDVGPTRQRQSDLSPGREAPDGTVRQVSA